jgi:5-methylcytosine-specific restriction endonuclease McrA
VDVEWSEEDLALLRDRVQASDPIGVIARDMDRAYGDVAVQASGLGVAELPKRPRKVPRGAGYDKQSVKKHVVALWRCQATLPQYARTHGLHPDAFVQAFRQHYPAAWADYVQARGEPASAQCAYCGDRFYPINGNQQFCTDRCGKDAKRDERYFGGNRKNTVGLLSGVCQVCGSYREKGISSHHIFGKDNDQDDAVLIALCRGCHQLVTILSSRKFATEAAAWEALISLVLLRRLGVSTRVRVEIAT